MYVCTMIIIVPVAGDTNTGTGGREGLEHWEGVEMEGVDGIVRMVTEVGSVSAESFGIVEGGRASKPGGGRGM